MFLKLREYHRPTALDEALALLTRPSPVTRALAGGTSLCGGVDDETEAVTDLADLGLNRIEPGALGAMATLQAIIDTHQVPACLREAARSAAPRTIRVAATLGGTLRAPDGGIGVPTALAALGATHQERGPLLMGVTFAVPVRSTFLQVSRTPADEPLLCAAAVLTADEAVRIALGGVAPAPLVAASGAGASWEGLEGALTNQIAQAAAITDNWLASATYRQEVGLVLAQRAVAALMGRSS